MHPLPAPHALRTVLVVDDEPALRVLGRLALQREGYAVLEAATPDEALRLAVGLRGPFDLLLTDVDLPGMCGRALADRVVAEHPGLRVLFTSGHDRDQLIRRGALPPQAGFLAKPFRVDDLFRKVREAFDAPSAVADL
jgi:CheY-like chemotaxis protein